MALAGGRNHIQYMNELAAKAAIALPRYDWETVNPDATNPLFKVIASFMFNGTIYSGTGFGRKKQDAKHEAAKDLYTRIQRSDGHNDITNIGDPIAKENIAALNYRDVNIEDEEYPEALKDNPIASLLDYALGADFPEPEYDENLKQEGPSHCPVFTVGCSIGDFMITGISKKKQSAKRISAFKMLKELKERKNEDGTYRGLDHLKGKGEIDTPEELERFKQLVARSSTVSALRDMNKTEDDFYGANIYRQEYEFADKLLSHPGETWKLLRGFAKQVDEKHPLAWDSANYYKTWLQTQEGGIQGFFQKVEKDLKFTSFFFTLKPKDSKPELDNTVIMVCLQVEIPKIDKTPFACYTAPLLDKKRISEAEDDCRVDILMQFGMLSVSRCHAIKRKGLP